MTDLRRFNIFRRGSRTYFYSSLFLPSDIRDDVFTLYSFVRTADNFVDVIPQQRKQFIEYKNECLKSLSWKKTSHPVIGPFIELSQRKGFKKDWIADFLTAMETDLTKKNYKNIKELEAYMYGSAQVVGMMMASIMNLPAKSYPYARIQGQAMQFINFIRDIAEDLEMGRVYIPMDDIRKSGFKNLKYSHVCTRPEQFRKFISLQIRRYRNWQDEAETGYKYIPKKYLTGIKTAADLYKQTADKLEKNPFEIYRVKIKPSILEIVYTAGKNSFL